MSRQNTGDSLRESANTDDHAAENEGSPDEDEVGDTGLRITRYMGSSNPAEKGSSSPPLKGEMRSAAPPNDPSRWSTKMLRDGYPDVVTHGHGPLCNCHGCTEQPKVPWCQTALLCLVVAGILYYYYHMFQLFFRGGGSERRLFSRNVVKILAALCALCVMMVVHITCCSGAGFNVDEWEERAQEKGRLMLGVGGAFGFVVAAVVVRFVLKHPPCINCGR